MRPDIGVGVFVFNPKGQFVVGVRKGSHGAGTPTPLIWTRTKLTDQEPWPSLADISNSARLLRLARREKSWKKRV